MRRLEYWGKEEGDDTFADITPFIHFACLSGNDYTLCGASAEQSKGTRKPVNCRECIGIVKACQRVKPSEMHDTEGREG